MEKEMLNKNNENEKSKQKTAEIEQDSTNQNLLKTIESL